MEGLYGHAYVKARAIIDSFFVYDMMTLLVVLLRRKMLPAINNRTPSRLAAPQPSCICQARLRRFSAPRIRVPGVFFIWSGCTSRSSVETKLLRKILPKYVRTCTAVIQYPRYEVPVLITCGIWNCADIEK